MRNIYKRTAWLVDDGILLKGYVSKRRFFPSNFGCGFSSQRIRRKNVGKILFYSEKEAIDKTGFQVAQ